jgi:glycosyltransferase involved in cell wall biosynthesis
MQSVIVIIPAFNEENGIGQVIEEIPKEIVKEIVVVNNNSSDNTEQVAREKGATVIAEPIAGYGRACKRGIEYVNQLSEKPDIIVFIDADHSDYPEEIFSLIEPIIKNVADIVIGSRALGKKEKGSMTPQQIFGNWLATKMISVLFGVVYSDLGPFRAIRYASLVQLNMQDNTYGWTVEMQVKACLQKLKIKEVPVRYRKRIGFSKISGTIKGTILAGYKIITTILMYGVLKKGS